jgi:hypothetical protein
VKKKIEKRGKTVGDREKVREIDENINGKYKVKMKNTKY